MGCRRCAIVTYVNVIEHTERHNYVPIDEKEEYDIEGRSYDEGDKVVLTREANMRWKQVQNPSLPVVCAGPPTTFSVTDNWNDGTKGNSHEPD